MMDCMDFWIGLFLGIVVGATASYWAIKDETKDKLKEGEYDLHTKCDTTNRKGLTKG